MAQGGSTGGGGGGAIAGLGVNIRSTTLRATAEPAPKANPSFMTWPKVGGGAGTGVKEGDGAVRAGARAPTGLDEREEEELRGMFYLEERFSFIFQPESISVW